MIYISTVHSLARQSYEHVQVATSIQPAHGKTKQTKTKQTKHEKPVNEAGCGLWMDPYLGTALALSLIPVPCSVAVATRLPPSHLSAPHGPSLPAAPLTVHSNASTAVVYHAHVEWPSFAGLLYGCVNASAVLCILYGLDQSRSLSSPLWMVVVQVRRRHRQLLLTAAPPLRGLLSLARLDAADNKFASLAMTSLVDGEHENVAHDTAQTALPAVGRGLCGQTCLAVSQPLLCEDRLPTSPRETRSADLETLNVKHVQPLLLGLRDSQSRSSATSSSSSDSYVLIVPPPLLFSPNTEREHLLSPPSVATSPSSHVQTDRPAPFNDPKLCFSPALASNVHAHYPRDRGPARHPSEPLYHPPVGAAGSGEGGPQHQDRRGCTSGTRPVGGGGAVPAMIIWNPHCHE